MRRGVFVGLGGNVGDTVPRVRAAMADLGLLPGTQVLARSCLYRSMPVGKLDQADFINAVAHLETSLSPVALMSHLLAVEARYGRVRSEKNGPRTLDLDLLLFGDLIVNEMHLTVPHPRMHERAFVLLPLIEIAPHCLIPGQGLAADLLAALPEQGVVQVDVA